MFSRRQILRIVLVLGLVTGSFLGMHQITGMDPIFFQPSLSGVKGLAWYLVGRYDDAAKAYRAHWRGRILDGLTSGDDGTDLLLSGNLDGAERVARERLVRAPSDVSARLLRAEVALERGAPAEALPLAADSLAIEPDSVDAQVMLSLAHVRAGAPGQAIDALNRALRSGTMGGRLVTFYQLLETTSALEREKSRPRPLCWLAQVHRYFRVFDRSHAGVAARYAREAVAAGDRSADAYLTLGILAEKAGRLDDALAAFQAAIQSDPHHAEAHRWAAIIYRERGDLVNEYRMITTAFLESQDPYYSEHLYLVLIEKAGEPVRAIELLTPLVKKAPNDAYLWARLGHAHSLVGHDAEAMTYFRRAMALAPRDPWIQSLMGWAFNRLGDPVESIAAYRRAIAITPTSPVLHKQLMEVYYADRRYREAIAEGETALRLGEPSIYAHAMVCNLYHNIADLERAEACCLRVLARDPFNLFANLLLPKIRHERALR